MIVATANAVTPGERTGKQHLGDRVEIARVASGSAARGSAGACCSTSKMTEPCLKIVKPKVPTPPNPTQKPHDPSQSA